MNVDYKFKASWSSKNKWYLRWEGGGGGMKLVFEIAVDRQTRNHVQTFEGVPNPDRCPRCS